MRLIRMMEKNKEFIVDAESAIKFFGFRLWRRSRLFKKEKRSDLWIEFPQNKIPSKSDRAKLNYWLENHKRFVSS